MRKRQTIYVNSKTLSTEGKEVGFEVNLSTERNEDGFEGYLQEKKTIALQKITQQCLQENKTNSTNLYPLRKGYLRETCKSQNINPIYLTLSLPSVLFRS